MAKKIRKIAKMDVWTAAPWILRPQTQRHTYRDREMDRGHRKAPPGSLKFRNSPKWTSGQLDENFETSEKQ